MLVEKLKSDMIVAMKAKDKEKLTVIRMVKGGIDKEHIDKKREINDELLIEVVNREIKQRNDSIVEFDKGGRIDLVNKNKEEIEILKSYLPEQLAKEEVEKIISQIFEELKPTSGKDMGIIMKEVTPKLKGKADMKLVSSIIKEKLDNI